MEQRDGGIHLGREALGREGETNNCPGWLRPPSWLMEKVAPAADRDGSH